MKIKSIIILISIFYLAHLYAVPAHPGPVTITQPDGSQLTIRRHGDEFFHYDATLDGYMLISNSKGFLTYAKQDANGKLISTNIRATNVEKRTLLEQKFVQDLTKNVVYSKQSIAKYRSPSISNQSASTPQKVFPLTGTPKSLVILVNFSDLNFVTPSPKIAFTNLLTQTGYSENRGTGSARDYFRDNSMGQFNPQFDVVGPFTLPGTVASYGANDASGNDIAPQQMVIDACAQAAANGVNFAQYDLDNNGVVDNVFIYYAGFNEAEDNSPTKINKNTIWPHCWSLNNTNTKFNGVSIYGYACTSELRAYAGANMCGIGTFCHEFGHVLGLDDMYVTGSTEPDHFTLSYWDIMDYGPYLNSGRTPPNYSSYERFFLKWLLPTELKLKQNVTLDTLSSSNKALLISQYANHNLNGANPNPVEFFLLENRQNKGWDTYLPGHGMLVTHLYYDQSTWASNEPNNNATAMGVDIVEADGIASEQTLSGDPFPGTSNVKSYSPLLRSGININKPLTNIVEKNGLITFNFASNLTILQSLQTFNTVQGTPSAAQTVIISGDKLSDIVSLSFKTGTHFEMKKVSDPETAWSKTITLTPMDSVLTNLNIQIRYNPTIPSYNNPHLETLVVSSGSKDYAETTLTGASTRPIYVTTPIANEATNTTFTGFVASWNNVFDATGYYLTLYGVSEGTSSLTNGFDNGIIASPDWTISNTTISTNPTYCGIEPPALQFANNKEYIETEKYIVPATSLSFFIRSIATNNGGLLVQALNDQNIWEKVDSILITTNLFDKKRTYTFEESKAYKRFRFTYTKGTGVITFDDVTVGFNKKVSYEMHDKWITNNVDSLTNLKPNTQYFYKVKASDKSLYYENTTAFSNTISITTKAYPSEKKLYTKYESNGDITVFLPSIDNCIVYVYNVLGQCLRTIIPDNTTFTLTDLPKNQIYIIKASKLVTKLHQ